MRMEREGTRTRKGVSVKLDSPVSCRAASGSRRSGMSRRTANARAFAKVPHGAPISREKHVGSIEISTCFSYPKDDPLSASHSNIFFRAYIFRANFYQLGSKSNAAIVRFALFHPNHYFSNIFFFLFRGGFSNDIFLICRSCGEISHRVYL